MSEARGESRGSLLSQSQLSESTVLNQDFADTDLFQPDVLAFKAGFYQTKTVSFASGAAPTLVLEKSGSLDNLGRKALKGEYQGKRAELMSRLIDKPENSQVLRPSKNLSGQQIQTSFLPHPPSMNVVNGQSSGFRTTMFKRDYQRRQKQIQTKQNIDSEPKLALSMLYKQKPKEIPVPIVPVEPSDVGDDVEVFSELDELLEATEVVAPDSPPVSERKRAKSEDKSVKFDGTTSGQTSPTRMLETSMEDEEDEEDEDDEFRYPGEIPIIQKRLPDKPFRPISGKKQALAKSKTTGRPISATKVKSQEVLSYLKKTKYDASVPVNDDVLFHLKTMRDQLGWATEIPRHGPECKKTMEKLNDVPTNEKHAASEDSGEFVYCLLRSRQNHRARYNPFDLQVVSANEARSHMIYWTVSASFITMCTQGENGNDESVNTPALWWLWERRLFYTLYDLPVFVKFRLWKTFKMWKKNIRIKKNWKSQVVVCKQLFIANEVLQGCLIHVRSLCEVASSSLTGVGQGDSAISLIKLEKGVTLTLHEFRDVQKQQGELALQKLNKLRETIIQIVWESCATVAEMEGITQGIRPEEGKKVRIQIPKEEVKKDKPEKITNPLYKIKYGNIPISITEKPKEERKGGKPLYAEIASWRKVLNRLASFLKTIDYLVLEMLRRLVMTAIRSLLDHLRSSYDVVDEREEQDEDANSERSVSSRSSGMFSRSPDSRISSRASFVVEKATKTSSDVTQTGYIIPHYDFDEPEIDDKPVDVDEVLNEIKYQNIVEIIAAPAFSLQLVLNAPKPATAQSTEQLEFKTTSGRSTYLQEKLFESQAAQTNKSVKFADEQEMSESGSEGESEYTDDSEEEGQEGKGADGLYSEEDETEKTEPDTGSKKFAYSGNAKKEKPTKSFVELSPSGDEFRQGLKEVIRELENTITQVIPMQREPKLSVFCSAPACDLKLNFDMEQEEELRETQKPWPDLDAVFGEDLEYQALNAELDSYMEIEMELIKQYSRNFEHFCLMVDQSRRLNVDVSMSKRQWSTEEFSSVLAAHTTMMREMKKMTIQKRVAMILVQSKNFRGSCLPYPSGIVDKTHERLPLIANRRNEDLLKIIKGASRKLDHYPKSVEEFVEHLSFLDKMITELPALGKEFIVVNKLFTIANDYNVKIEPEELALYQTLGPSFQHLKSTILFCEAKKDENIRKFSNALDNLIEKTRSKLMDLKNRVRDPDLLSIDTLAVSALETLKYLQEEVQTVSVKARSYTSYQERFGSSLSQSKKGFFGEEYLLMDKRDDHSAQEIQNELSEIERDLTLRRLLWQSQEEWTKLVDEWTATIFDGLNVEMLQKNVNRFTQTVYMLEKGLPSNEVMPRLKEKVMDFKQGMPVITSLRNPSLRQRHWELIERLIGKSISRDKSFTLGSLLEMNIFKHKERIQDISTTASNEATLEIMLQKIIDLWQSTDFRLLSHAGRDTLIIAGADDIMAQLEESQVTIGTIRGSRYVTPIKAQVEEWERKLQVFSRTLEEWLTCQRNWLYLEQIFSTPDIQRQLPSEFKLFSQVDKAWKDIMRRVEDRPNALKSAIAPGTLDTLQSANTNLEKIQKCLEDYLETKRLVFPRFYFLSNDELLDILAQSKDPNAVQPHLGKCFGNIKYLDIKHLPRQPPTVKSMCSLEGEVVAMPRNVRARGPVEQWLGSVESGMFETVKKHLKLGLADWLGIELQDWVVKHPGQVVLTVAQIMFNKDVVRCFDHLEPSQALVEVKEKIVDSLNSLAGLVTSNLSSHQRMSIEALLTITVHNRDIVQTMVTGNVVKRDDFQWTKQLRYEWDETSNSCLVMQCNATFQYGYEYLGASSRLVITPLTDRCYLTLTGALHLHLGGSPAGPAGTGKTETVKDLSKSMGKQCVVFNCSEGLDYKMLGKFFSGLAQSGSWCCFDEFNRIDVEVLSVVAQQIHTIKTAKDLQALRFMFEGRDIKLNMTCGYFITMNPTYAGRVELPDNLKSLFRPVAMMVPDYTLIAEIMLFSEGFVCAKQLSLKIVNMYQLASRQLSQQDHYDFGMRAIKSVLVMAGHARQQAQNKILGSAKKFGEMEESYILIHSLRDANMPKFLSEDVPLFESIMDDLFPGITPPEQDQGILEKAISMAIRDQSLQHWPSQMEMVKQFYNQILVRHGVMLVGPTGGGKTTVRNILQKALVLMPTIVPQDSTPGISEIGLARRQSILMHNRAKKGHVEIFSVNPKCVKLGELYGATDPMTFEWTDGLIASAIRRFARDSPHTSVTKEEGRDLRPISELTTISESGTSTVLGVPSESGDLDSASALERREHNSSMSTDWKWMILDGPVDTLWVENLNTVLDDSKVLCLASGERISLSSGMRIIFEVDSLAQASPATISRCAMVFMDPVDLGWKPYVKTWLQKLPKEMPESGKCHLQALFDHSIDKGLKFFKKFRHYQFVPAPELSLINCLCNLLFAFLDFMCKNGGFGRPDREESFVDSSDTRIESRTSSRSSSRSTKHGRSKRRASRRVSRIKEESSYGAGYGGERRGSSGHHKNLYLQKNPGQLLNILGKLFVFAFTWSMGGNFKRQEDVEDDDTVNRRGLDHSDTSVNVCNEFDNFVRELFEVEPPLGVRLPTGNRSMYGYFVDMDSGAFVPWDSLVPSTKSLIEKGVVITIGETMGVGSDHKKKREEADIVQTVDIVRFSFLTGLLLLNKHPVLLTGESGVGKTAIIDNMLGRLQKGGGTGTKSGTVLGDVFSFSEKHTSLLESITNLTKLGHDDEAKSLDFVLGSSRTKQLTGVVSSMIQFSAQTSAARLQSQITQKLIKKGKDTLGAPKGRKVLVFVDDLNMPAPEEYGAQPPLELLRQFLELNGFYDTGRLVWKDIMDVTLISACGPVGGGRNPISPRLLKHFCMFALPQPSTRSLQHIYQVQLGRFFHDGEFPPEVIDCMFSLVSASIAVYYRMCNTMLPTPSKSHYTFNIRDLSKVIQGLMRSHESVIISKDNCAQLMAHEATRVFHDRLVSRDDRTKFFQFLSDNLHDYFKVKWSSEMLMNEEVLFGDFFDLDEEVGSRVYRPVSDRKKLAQALEEYYMRMNYGNSQASQMVFFKDAVEHITRAARVFRQPGGHMMLVGLDGTGKSTIVQLASYIANCDLFKLTLHRHYGSQEFRDDLKKVFLGSGVKGNNIVFLLSDSDIVNESFLEDINCILNSGEVPDLFDQEELDSITMELKNRAAEMDIPDTKVAVYQFFIRRVKQKLHVVLTMSPAGGTFRQRCRMNPALINCCTIDWYDVWDDEAMLSVAQVFFQNAEFIADPEYDLDVLKQRVGQVCVSIHKSIGKMAAKFLKEMRRHHYSTPSSYMEFIRVYSKTLKENKTEFANNKERLLVGLFKLSEANSLVGTMQDELLSLGPKIEEKRKDTEVLLGQLEKDQEAVKQVRVIVEQEENIMKKETQIVQDYADECERDLASVLPALETAMASLETLDKASISEIRVYMNPPELVMTVMAAVCVLFQKKPDWSTAKQMLGDPNFLKKLLHFDKNSLPDKVFHKLKRYSKHTDFNPDKVGHVSFACCSICEWVLALEHYNEVYKMVKPKQKRVEEAKEALQLAQQSLAQKQASLKKIEDHLNMIQQQYQDSVNQRESLKERKITTGLRIQRASVLIGALANEKIRWAESVNELDLKLQGLVGNTLVVAAAVAYIGSFTAKYRKELVTTWLDLCNEAQIPISGDFDLVKSTVDAHKILLWQTEGLPRDGYSTENALIVNKARKFPLLIDPQGQAFNWIREMEGVRLKVVAVSDPTYMRTLETAIRVGDPILLKDVSESLDPAIRSVLHQETYRKGGHILMKLGDTEIEYNENFRLYMTTSMPNPHYLPAVFIQVNIINFTVTFEGLQEQLLSAVVRQERPQLEIQRCVLLESIANDLQLLRDLEDKSLGLLQKSEGHILDDQDLVETLQKSKGMAEEIYHRVSESEETEKNISLARKRYLPVATRGATLYFVLAELSGIDVMYQFSLEWFQDMFIACISGIGSGTVVAEKRRKSSTAFLSGVMRPSRKQSTGSISDIQKLNAPLPAESRSSAELKTHMLLIINRLTASIYRVVSVALFATHQLTFSFMVCTSIMRANSKYDDITDIGSIHDQEWQIFLQGYVMASMVDDKLIEEHDGLTAMERLEAQSTTNPSKMRSLPQWLSDTLWRQCRHLDATMPLFDKLCRSIMTNPLQWNLFRKCDNPYKLMTECFDPSHFILDGEDQSFSKHGVVFAWECLSRFQRLILIKALRLDTLMSAINQFVFDQMGDSCISKGSFDLKEIYEESTSKTPLIFILSPGSDPAAQMLRFAKELRGSTLHLDMISLGRGQGPKAEELISKAQILKGRWVFLQNCHLAASWMPKLQQIVENFNKPSDDLDPQFRLWLSSKPDPCFPISILQTGLKMTIEPPQGLRANMLRTFGSGGTGIVTEKMYEDVSAGQAWPNLLFGLCLFNSVVHERKKYGALGWNVPYEFNDSDLEVSIMQLQNFLHEHDDIPWEALTYLTGEVTYGGRVTDEWDRRCLHALLSCFFCSEALDIGYTYSRDGIYKPVEKGCTHADIVRYIEMLPKYDSPEIFGMTENAENAYRELQATGLVDTIIGVQPQLSLELIGSEKSSDDIVLDLAADIMEKLPKTVEEQAESETQQGYHHLPQLKLKNILLRDLPDFKDKDKEKVAYAVVNGILGNSALITVLRQEVDRFNNLLHTIHTSLNSLILAIKGEVIMSESLEDAYNALINQKVPRQWMTAAYQCCKPLGAWVKDLIMRVDFFSRWAELLIINVDKVLKPLLMMRNPVMPSAEELEKEGGNKNHPRSFWLSGFFFPQGFITGVLQNHARKLGISVDSLTLDFCVQSNSNREESLTDLKKTIPVKDEAFNKGSLAPDNGVLVFGLYIDGACWDCSLESLQDLLPGQRFSRLPEIHFLPVQISEQSKSSLLKVTRNGDNSMVTAEYLYDCPLYRTSTRTGTLSSTGHSTNFVSTIQLPSIHSPEFWIMRGVAMLCQLND